MFAESLELFSASPATRGEIKRGDNPEYLLK